MTDPSAEAQREAIAAAFGRDLDPLAEFAEQLERVDDDLDPFDLFIEFDLETRGLADFTIEDYRRVFDEWREHMIEENRHPACPNEEHVRRFIHRLQDKGNQSNTILKKLAKISGAYEYWQKDTAFPHPQDYDPIQMAIDSTPLESPEKKEPPRIPIPELREVMETVTRIRDRAIIALQLKLGMRCGEVANIQLPEVHIANPELEKHYPEAGSHERLSGRENAIFIPSRYERNGNKSRRARVLPLDDELCRVLLRYLLIRPTADEPWLFLSKQQHRRLEGGDANRAWKEAFGDRYPETENHKRVTSHYGRHRFTTYWRVEQDLNRELIKYMRGDIIGGGPDDEPGAIDTYIHTYYEDIEPIYREQIFKLGL